MSSAKPIVITSKLKIKGLNNNSKKRKLNENVNDQIDEKSNKSAELSSSNQNTQDNEEVKEIDKKTAPEGDLFAGLTEMQKKHKLRQLENQKRNITKIVSKSYRDRIDEYNNYLSSMTEHNDVPKVSAAGNG